MSESTLFEQQKQAVIASKARQSFRNVEQRLCKIEESVALLLKCHNDSAECQCMEVIDETTCHCGSDEVKDAEA